MHSHMKKLKLLLDNKKNLFPPIFLYKGRFLDTKKRVSALKESFFKGGRDFFFFVVYDFLL